MSLYSGFFVQTAEQYLSLRYKAGLSKRLTAITLYILFISLSGLLYNRAATTSILELDPVARAVALIVGLIGSLLLVLTVKPRLHRAVIILAFFIIYGGMVGVVIGGLTNTASSVIRFCTYLLVFVFAYSVPRPLEATYRIVGIMGCVYVGSALFDLLVGRNLQINQAHRIMGTVGSPIGFAGALYVTMVGALFLWAVGRRRSFLLLGIACVTAIFATGTRSVSVGALFVIVLWSFLALRSLSGRIVYAVMFCIVGVIAFPILLPKLEVVHRLLAIINGESLDPSSSFRFYILKTVWNRIEGWEIIYGVGLGGFSPWFQKVTGIDGVGPHWEFLWLLMEGGVIGIVLYMLAIITILCTLVVHRSLILPCKHLVMFGLLSVSAQMTVLHFANPLWFPQIMIPLFFYMGIFCSPATWASHTKTFGLMRVR